MPVRVLIVDDSALVRRALTDGLAADPDIEVVGVASDPYIARERIHALNPDVLTLDIEMPRMDGLTFLKVLMEHRPMPVIIMSSLTTAGSQKALDALHAGAADVVPKPSSAEGLAEEGLRLAERIKAIARARPRPRASRAPTPPPPSRQRRAVPSVDLPACPARALILLGASTGGTEAIREVLSALPAGLPGIVVVQHIPSQFSRAFATRLDDCCAFEVREAAPGDAVRPGLALVAPGGLHLVVRWTGSHYVVDLNAGPPIHHQRPSVDVLFDSAARSGARDLTFAALLTGMGADGAQGMLSLRRAGAITVAQDETTSVVFGMPREAIALGAAQAVLPLPQIAPAIVRFARRIAPVGSNPVPSPNVRSQASP